MLLKLPKKQLQNQRKVFVKFEQKCKSIISVYNCLTLLIPQNIVGTEYINIIKFDINIAELVNKQIN